MSEDRFPSCQSRRNVELRGKFTGKLRIDEEVRDCEKGKVRDKDEVVRYMLNPPRYLQGKERSENCQGKALSFGVMDWERLERWKHSTSEGSKGAAFFSDASSSGVITSSEETAFTSLSRSSSISATTGGYREENHFPTCSGASSSHKAEHSRENESSLDRDWSGFSGRLVRRSELDQKFRPGLAGFSPNTRHQRVTLRSRNYANAMDGGAKKRAEERVKVDVNKKRFDKILTSGTAAVQSGKEDESNSERLKPSLRTDESTRPEIDLSHQSQQRKPQNIVLLRPSKHAANCHGEKYQASLNKNLVEDHHSSELRSRIPHSCPLLFSHQTDPELGTTSEQSETSKTVECNDDRRGECSKPIDLEDRNQSSGGNPCVVDQEMPKVASRRVTHASPNRGSSFGRSFSFKETSSRPASSSPSHVSAKSGLLTSDTSVYGNGSTRAKRKGHNRTKSSPLRRMIDPFLKPNHETRVSNPKQTLNKPPENEKKQQNSTVRALLQFTERKGVHLFQFVVDNNSDNVLAATMKSLDSSTRLYTFYSVKEVRRKSGGWLGQGSKEKSHGFEYTIIGHMRSLTSLTSDLTAWKSESVLFEVEANHGDQTMANAAAEAAAIVEEMDCSSNPGGWNTEIILPGGIHTLPKDGNALSPLIDRWKSGGTCDCGGWDVGCKLRVLSDRRSHGSKPNRNNSSRFRFFDQERDEPTLTVLSLGEGLHSVEFDESVSLSQAFFISLTISSREEPPLVIGDDRIRRKPPAKYASYPPVSPAGRV